MLAGLVCMGNPVLIDFVVSRGGPSVRVVSFVSSETILVSI